MFIQPSASVTEVPELSLEKRVDSLVAEFPITSTDELQVRLEYYLAELHNKICGTELTEENTLLALKIIHYINQCKDLAAKDKEYSLSVRILR